MNEMKILRPLVIQNSNLNGSLATIHAWWEIILIGQLEINHEHLATMAFKKSLRLTEDYSFSFFVCHKQDDPLLK